MLSFKLLMPGAGTRVRKKRTANDDRYPGTIFRRIPDPNMVITAHGNVYGAAMSLPSGNKLYRLVLDDVDGNAEDSVTTRNEEEKEENIKSILDVCSAGTYYVTAHLKVWNDGGESTNDDEGSALTWRLGERQEIEEVILEMKVGDVVLFKEKETPERNTRIEVLMFEMETDLSTGSDSGILKCRRNEPFPEVMKPTINRSNGTLLSTDLTHVVPEILSSECVP